jgi:sarcosine oxidase
MERFDAIVIGTGGMGAAALMHLAARGARVCGLDRFPPGHDRGSSHGQTRLIRLAYFEHPDYVPLLRRAYELWRELEIVSGRPLLVESGLLMAGPPRGEVLAGAVASATIHSLPIERMTSREAMGRWPGIRLPEEWAAVHEAQAGYLFVEDCVRAHAAEAVRLGARIEINAAVRGWRSVGPDGSGGHVVVETDRGNYAADRLVVTAGAWAANLLQVPSLRLQVLRKSLFWYESESAVRGNHPTGNLPCFAFDAPAGFFYGFPAVDARGVKIAEHTGGTPCDDPLAVDRCIDARERERVEAVLATHLPTVSRHLTDHAVCLYTMSPDGHFVVGHHPEHARVAIAAGFSGHGFKFASVMGEVLADLALDGKTAHPIGFLSPKRFLASENV